jgi:hypothetical protein
MKLQSASRLVLAASLAAVALLAPKPVAALYITGSEHVTDSLLTPPYTDAGVTHGPYGLVISYLRGFDGARVTADVQIEFLFDAALGFDDVQRADYRATVEANIEGIWNNKFVITDTMNHRTLPIVIDLTTTGLVFDQFVTVHPGSGRSDALNWFIGDTAPQNAHEFGHMLGLFDEFIGGAVNRYPNPTLTDTGLMGLGALAATPEMFPRYFDQHLSFVVELNPDGAFQLSARSTFAATPVPEPWTIVLVSLGSGAVWLARRRRAGRHSRSSLDPTAQSTMNRRAPVRVDDRWASCASATW